MSSETSFIVVKFRAGCALLGDGRSVLVGGRRRAVDLPSGARLVPALRIPPANVDDLTEAERELSRYVHLRLPPDLPIDEALQLARGWDFVERAEPAPAADR